MLQILANGIQLDTREVNFNLNLKNPFFQNELDGSYAYDINLPLTDSNKKNLSQFAHRLSSNQKYPTVFSEVFFSGRKLFDGNFIVTSSGKDIRGSIGIGQSNFLYLSKKYLDEINYGSKTFADEAEALAYFNNIKNQFYPDVAFALPVLKSQSADTYLPSGTTGYFEKEFMNKWDPLAETYTIDDSGDKGIIMPQMYLLFILNKLFSENGYFLKDNFFITDPEYSKLILFNIYNANGGIPDIDDKPGYDAEITNINYNFHIAHQTISSLITGLQNLLNVRFYFNHNTKSVKALDALEILNSTDFIDITDKIISGHQEEINEIDGFKLTQTVDDTDETSKNFEEIDSFIEKFYGGTVETINDLPSKYIGWKYYYIISEESFYIWDSITESWGATSSPFRFMFFKPNQDLSIESGITSLLDISPQMVFTTSAIDYRDILIRLMFYKGYVEYASSGDYYPTAQNTYNNKSLQHYLSTLYLTRWKKYLDFILNARVVTFKAQFSAADISSFDLSKKYRIDGIDYLIKEIKTPISDRTIEPSTIECYKV